MKYAHTIEAFLESSDETVDAFALRASVHRSTVFRALKNHNLTIDKLERMLEAAGCTISVIRSPTTGTTSASAPAQVGDGA